MTAATYNAEVETGLSVINVLLVPANIIARAFVLAKLWAWFVVPLGVASISMSHTYGLSLIPTALLLGISTEPDGPTRDAVKKSFIRAFFIYPFLLLLGWITLQVMQP